VIGDTPAIFATSARVTEPVARVEVPLRRGLMVVSGLLAIPE